MRKTATLTQDEVDSLMWNERADRLREQGAPITGVIWDVPVEIEMKKINNEVTYTWYWDA